MNVAAWLVAQGMHTEVLGGVPVSPAELQDAFFYEVTRRRRELHTLVKERKAVPPAQHFAARTKTVFEVTALSRGWDLSGLGV